MLIPNIFNDSEELIKNLKSPQSFTLFPFYLSAVIYIYDFTHNITYNCTNEHSY